IFTAWYTENILANAENNGYNLLIICGDYMYIHKRKEWPNLTWDQSALAAKLAEVRHLQGKLLGRMEGLGFALRNEATLKTLTNDVLKTSEIEGENLDSEQVRSSIARRLGMDTAG